MEGIECDHADHAEAATMMQTLTQRLLRKDFLVAAAKFLVAAAGLLVAAVRTLVAAPPVRPDDELRESRP
jgi:hypothetical protein